MKQRSLTVLLATQMYSLFLLLYILWQGSHLGYLSRGVFRTGKGITYELGGSLARYLGPIHHEELNYVEEDSSKEFFGC